MGDEQAVQTRIAKPRKRAPGNAFVMQKNTALLGLLVGGLICLVLGWLVISGMGGQGPFKALFQPQANVLVATISQDDDPTIGPQGAAVTIVEFSDFNCGYCGRWHEEVFAEMMDRYEGQIRFVYRDFPVVGGQTAAEAAECADEQDAFWQYHDVLFSNQGSFVTASDYVALAQDLGLDSADFRTCLETHRYQAEVLADLEEGRSYGVRSTPTFFINGTLLVGAYPLSQFQLIIDEYLGLITQ